MCAKFFSHLFEIKTRRLLTIARAKLNGTGVTENRGGNRKEATYRDAKNDVRDFIRTLRVSESHYGRKKSRRLYLSCDLSVRELVRLYNEKAPVDKKVLLFLFSIFRKILSE